MGLSKRLVPEQISFESVGSGGSSGWQAPEQLISRSGGTARQTNSGKYLPFEAGREGWEGGEGGRGGEVWLPIPRCCVKGS